MSYNMKQENDTASLLFSSHGKDTSDIIYAYIRSQMTNFARVFHLFKIPNYDVLTLRSEILFLEFSSREKKARKILPHISYM